MYYDDQSQKLGIFDGTKTEDILNLIKVIFKFSPTDELYFLDEDGIPIVPSCSIPSGTQLFVHKK